MIFVNFRSFARTRHNYFRSLCFFRKKYKRIWPWNGLPLCTALYRKFETIFPEMKLRRLAPNFYIYVSVSDLYNILMIGPHILLYCLCWPIVGIYKSLTYTWMWKLGTRPHSFISGNICFEFSVQCICSVYIVHTLVWMCNIAFPGPSIVVSYNHWIMSVCVCRTPLLHHVLSIERVTRNIIVHKKKTQTMGTIYILHGISARSITSGFLFFFIFIFDSFFCV